MSISEYFMPRTRTGMSRSMCGPSTSLQIGCSARDNQNSHASSATPSSWSCVRTNMYCNNSIKTLQLTWRISLFWPLEQFYVGQDGLALLDDKLQHNPHRCHDKAAMFRHIGISSQLIQQERVRCIQSYLLHRAQSPVKTKVFMWHIINDKLRRGRFSISNISNLDLATDPAGKAFLAPAAPLVLMNTVMDRLWRCSIEAISDIGLKWICSLRLPQPCSTKSLKPTQGVRTYFVAFCMTLQKIPQDLVYSASPV